MLKTAFAVLLLLGAASPGVAHEADEEAIYNRIEQLHGDASGFLALAAALSEAVGTGEHDTFAALLTYPATVDADGETYDVPDAELFARDFETLVQSELQIDLVDWTLGDTIVTSDGVGILGGRTWFANACADETCERAAWIVLRIANE